MSLINCSLIDKVMMMMMIIRDARLGLVKLSTMYMGESRIVTFSQSIHSIQFHWRL